ncbi:MAG: ASCH domain-containing protein [Egibacteraceae bacterium]
MSGQRIIDKLREASVRYGAWAAVPELLDETVGIHVAVMREPFLSFLFDGSKTVESRFSKNSITPYRRIAVGDLVCLKAGPVVGSFRASSTEFVALNDAEFERLRRDYRAAICAHDERFWAARADKRYTTLVGVEDVRRLTPVPISKRDRRGWMTLRTPVTPT